MKIIDLSHRLPGPLAGKILADLGFEVIKIEDEKLKDPFLDGFFQAFDSSFVDWYRELNRQKKIIRLDLSSPQGIEQLHQEIKNSDGMIISQSEKLKSLWKLQSHDLAPYPLAVVELAGSERTQQPMHDLNALAESGLLHLYLKDVTQPIVAPPFLPFAGITYGQQLASILLHLMLLNQKMPQYRHQKVYLLETIESIYRALWPEKTKQEGRYKFLHNGAYPCYSIYRLKDRGFLAVAAVEEKFWVAFSSAFKIQLKAAERFNRDPDSFNQVAEAIHQLDFLQAQNLLSTNQWCVSLIDI